MKTEQRPHGKCGARTRRGSSCRRPAMRNGRCRLHGGLSTGPKTQEGRNRIRLALLKHGRYTREARQERLECRELVRISRGLLHQIQQGNEPLCPDFSARVPFLMTTANPNNQSKSNWFSNSHGPEGPLFFRVPTTNTARCPARVDRLTLRVYPESFPGDDDGACGRIRLTTRQSEAWARWTSR
jgi:hypothetical protein